jgi:hypothetical protein
MNPLAWNCRGLGNPRAVRTFRDLQKMKAPKVLFLSETKLNVEEMEWIRVGLKYDSAFVVPSKGRSGGLALLWDEDVDLSITSYTRFHVDAQIKSQEGLWRFTGFYGHPETAKRKGSWALLKYLKEISPLPWVCMGDFNEILSGDEKAGVNQRPQWQMEDFREAIQACELYDLCFSGPKVTWNNSRDVEGFSGGRLDRGFGNMLWKEMFKNAMIVNIPVSYSDHMAISLVLLCNDQLRKRAPRLFCFEQAWTKHEECEKVIVDVWRDTESPETPTFQLVEKLKLCRKELIGWSKASFGNIKIKLEELEETLKQLESNNQGQHSAQIKILKMEVNELLEKEEVYWKQRARIAWLKEGDRNTKFFHSKATQRQKKNMVKGLIDKEGRWHQDPNKMEEIAVEYFEDIFTSTNSVDLDSSTEGIEKFVTDAMNQSLTCVFREEEVDEAIHQMHPSKAPGPDGFSAAFYQKYWNTVGPKVRSAVLSMLNDRTILQKINFTYIVLIPKKKNPKSMSEFRPISLCNVIYKIVAKVLANRLKMILPQVISDNQSAFVPERLITNNILIAYELLHQMNSRRRGKKEFMALKLDMSFDVWLEDYPLSLRDVILREIPL